MTELARKQVRKTYTVLKDSWGSKKIEEVIQELKHLRSQGFSEVEVVERTTDFYGYGNAEPTQVFRAVQYCEESDYEYNKRVEEENKLKELRRADYERLRAEFEGEMN
jgi:L-alanine-DL-glutamate epimerase-like enolase superfamily enzyme